MGEMTGIRSFLSKPSNYNQLDPLHTLKHTLNTEDETLATI